MNKNAKSTIGITLVLTMLIATLAYIVTADTECSGQDCSVAAYLTVGNSDPEIIEVDNGITVTLTAESSKVVAVIFNVTDTDGYEDLNDSSAQCVAYKSGESDRTSSVCTAQNQAGNYLEYTCNVSLQYYDAAAADWKWNCSVGDDSNSYVFNDSNTFTINALHYIDQDLSTLTWSTIASGVDDQEANAAISFDNGGNQDYENASVTAQNATDGGSNVIPATVFSLDTDTGQTTGQTYMADNSSVSITSWFTLVHGESASEEVYAYVDAPVIASGSYNSTGNWLIEISA